MKKPTKEEVKGGIQFFLLCYLCVMGFYITYSLVWVKIGFPIEGWSLLTCMVLAILSTGGYIHWVANN
jgi:hypothetical protein